MMRSAPFRIATLICLAAPGAGLAQTIGGNTAPGQAGAYTLTVKSQLVVETVVAKDKQGKFIGGLSAKDFTVTEDGVTQTIRFCEHEQLPTEADALPPLTSDEQNITIYNRLTRTAIAPEGPAQPSGSAAVCSRSTLT
jgi:hypothetical protein